MELVEILKGVELCRGLDAQQLGRLAAISHREEYNADQPIFDQGTHGEKMYVITRGEVEIRIKDGKGGKPISLYLGQGQIFGEMALLDQSDRSASVIACQNNTVVYSISSDDFLNLCTSDTALGYIMMRNMAMDLSFKLRHRNLDASSAS
ncbi:MAG: cyclic nucleotide-binding domain-containing protein [Chloroflexi bacterium]|nr:cyclic nucleotide-binding domain-containing protein [Chloroflexota bacterium]